MQNSYGCRCKCTTVRLVKCYNAIFSVVRNEQMQYGIVQLSKMLEFLVCFGRVLFGKPLGTPTKLGVLPEK